MLRVVFIALTVNCCDAFSVMSAPRSTVLHRSARSCRILLQQDEERTSAPPPEQQAGEPMGTVDEPAAESAAPETSNQKVDLIDAATLVFGFFLFLSFLPDGIRPF